MRRRFLRGMTGDDGFPIMDVYARARHTGLLDVYKGKPVMTRHMANHGYDGARFRRKRRASAKHSPSQRRSVAYRLSPSPEEG
jgi:hypothetical protein